MNTNKQIAVDGIVCRTVLPGLPTLWLGYLLIAGKRYRVRISEYGIEYSDCNNSQRLFADVLDMCGYSEPTDECLPYFSKTLEKCLINHADFLEQVQLDISGRTGLDDITGFAPLYADTKHRVLSDGKAVQIQRRTSADNFRTTCAVSQQLTTTNPTNKPINQ